MKKCKRKYFWMGNKAQSEHVHLGKVGIDPGDEIRLIQHPKSTIKLKRQDFVF